MLPSYGTNHKSRLKFTISSFESRDADFRWYHGVNLSIPQERVKVTQAVHNTADGNRRNARAAKTPRHRLTDLDSRVSQPVVLMTIALYTPQGLKFPIRCQKSGAAAPEIPSSVKASEVAACLARQNPLLTSVLLDMDFAL